MVISNCDDGFFDNRVQSASNNQPSFKKLDYYKVKEVMIDNSASTYFTHLLFISSTANSMLCIQRNPRKL